MKRIAITFVLTLVAFAATSSFGQSCSLRFDVPFAFSADGRSYAAGHYELCVITGGSMQTRQLRNIKTGDSSFVTLKSPNKSVDSAAASVKFASNGERSYLTSLSDYGTTWKVPVSESDLERLGKSPAKKIIIVARK
jgi:hypothetical protein